MEEQIFIRLKSTSELYEIQSNEFPLGLPVRSRQLSYQYPEFHCGWKGQIAWNIFVKTSNFVGHLFEGEIAESLKWLFLVWSDINKVDPGFYEIDTHSLSFDQYQALGRYFRKKWARTIVTGINPLLGLCIRSTDVECVETKELQLD